MKEKIFFSVGILLIMAFLVTSSQENFDDFQTLLSNSGPYIGADNPNLLGFDGSGIKIAIIDTGVDYNHPDLLGIGPNGKVMGGYDFFDNDRDPLDTNGHGTEVAGIIAADGELKGIAPKSRLLAYRVSDDGESVSSDLIIKAINQAIEDQADIINISLGVNKTNQRIDEAVNKAIRNGIVVVTAAGNNGPELKSIGSPGINPNAITVGATYNNVSSSLVATLEIGENQFQVLPMIGTESLENSIIEKLVYGKFGRIKDLSNLDVKDSIILIERGSDIENEIVYFSDKENNAAKRGAKAIVVYNNIPGIFLGELVHEFSGPNYHPTIPSLSLSRKDGLFLREFVQNKTSAKLDVFYHPDFVAHFSSRGPVSPFYIKPDLVAPGAFINSTLIHGKYNLTSGTSFATPHVTGTAALLLQKDKSLDPSEIKSFIITTTDPVYDQYKKKVSTEIAGSGRLNVTKAFNAKLLISPPYLNFNLSTDKQIEEKFLELKSIDASLENIEINFEKNDFVDLNYNLDGDYLQITASLKKEFFGKNETWVSINHEGISYFIPIIVNITKGSVSVNEDEGKLNFKVTNPKEWSYAKFSAKNTENGKIYSTSSVPGKNTSINIYEPGQYWIESKIRSNKTTYDAYETILVEFPASKDNFYFLELIDIPSKSLLIVLIFAVIMAVIGLKIGKGWVKPSDKVQHF